VVDRALEDEVAGGHRSQRAWRKQLPRVPTRSRQMALGRGRSLTSSRALLAQPPLELG